MSNRRLSPLRRAYVLGYHRGLNKARAELRNMAQRLDDEIAELADEMQGTRPLAVQVL